MKRLLALMLATASLPLAAQAPTPAPADTPGRTAAGVQFTQPKDFTLTRAGPATVLTPPEQNMSVAIVEVGAATDARDAATKAWAARQPGFSRKLLLAVPAPAKDGWDERVSLSYETSPNERRVVAALALRKGPAWTVMLADGAQATFEKRAAATGLFQSSLRPAGYAKESFAGKTAHRLTPERVKLMTDFVQEAMRELQVPGAGIALIDNGRIVYEGGLGVRELGSTEPVTARTKFMVASNTKGMATLLLSKLADEGKLRWDQPVTQLYPAFRLGDDATTRSTLVRHLVCACTGLPRKDLAWILSSPDVPATDTFKQLAVTQPTSRFGELFQYNNLMASAAGYVGGALAYPRMEVGAAFDRAMEQRIFEPLGMRDTTFDFAEAMRGDWARPHALDLQGRAAPVNMGFNYAIVPHRPAGGAWSTAHDMARYAQLELGKGMTPEGRRLVSEANILARRTRGVQTGEDAWYGMGLFEAVVNGVPVVYHGGSMSGYKSNFYVLPEAGIGAVILTNSDEGGAMLQPFLRRLLEVAYDGRPEAMADVKAAAQRFQAGRAEMRARLAANAAPDVLGRLAARYENPDLGPLLVSRQGGATRVRAGVIDQAVVARRNPDGSHSVVGTDPGSLGFEYVVGNAAGKRTLTVRDGQHEYVFAEVS